MSFISSQDKQDPHNPFLKKSKAVPDIFLFTPASTHPQLFIFRIQCATEYAFSVSFNALIKNKSTCIYSTY